MISGTTASECYVYITLPGETEFVTAGKFELTTNRQGTHMLKTCCRRARAFSLNRTRLK